MARLLRALLPVCAALCLTSCGQAAEVHSGAGRARTGADATSGAAAVFPVTLVRRGGIVGFNDRMRISADGTVTFSRHGSEQQQCRLEQPLLSHIAHAARQVQWPDRSLPSTTARSADELVVLIRSPRGAADLGAAAVRDLQDPLTRVLADVSLPAGQQQLCTPLE